MEYVVLLLHAVKQMRHRPACVNGNIFATMRFLGQWDQRFLMEAFIGRVHVTQVGTSTMDWPAVASVSTALELRKTTSVGIRYLQNFFGMKRKLFLPNTEVGS